MREGREWREHIDYYGIAATAYCLLFGTYMEVVKVNRIYSTILIFKSGLLIVKKQLQRLSKIAKSRLANC